MKFYFTLLLLAPLLVGCLSTGPKTIVTIDPDTFLIAREGEDSLAVRQELWEKADRFCAKRQMYFMPVAKTYSQTRYEMKFRCLNAGDPELLRDEAPFPKKRYHKKLGGYGEVSY